MGTNGTFKSIGLNGFKWVHKGKNRGFKIIMNSIGLPLNPGSPGACFQLLPAIVNSFQPFHNIFKESAPWPILS